MEALGIGFAEILLCLTVITGVAWSIDRLWARKRRAADGKDPWWVEWIASFFPVILVVFGLRSFVAEPFKIPSGSMIPTLLVGDYILVNKFIYGIRLPVVNRKIVDIEAPKRGDVVVFRYPENPSQDFIKRVVGLPGDRVAYQNKRLTINGVDVPVRADGEYLHVERMYYSNRFVEKLGDVEHAMLNDRDAPPYLPEVHDFPMREKCLYNSAGVICQVPSGHYFMMGDNRDASSDSRVWGFVPERNIVGKAFFIWMHFWNFGRIGPFH